MRNAAAIVIAALNSACAAAQTTQDPATVGAAPAAKGPTAVAMTVDQPKAFPGDHRVCATAMPFNRRQQRPPESDIPEEAKNRNKSRVGAKVEHVFGVIKSIFGFRNVQ